MKPVSLLILFLFWILILISGAFYLISSFSTDCISVTSRFPFTTHISQLETGNSRTTPTQISPTANLSHLTTHNSRLTLHNLRIISSLTAETLHTTLHLDTIIYDSIHEIQSSSDTSAAVQVTSISGQQNPWLWKVNYFGKSFTLVNALIVTIVTSTALMIILLIIILLNRTRMEREQKLRQFLLEKYQSLIVEYLYGDVVPDEFLKIASDDFRRQVLIDQIIDVSINLKGDTGEKLTRLYNQLGLDKDSIRKAYSRKWHHKVKGFRELAFMNNREANKEIYKALNSPNEILRMEAQIALVRLSGENPFLFLSELKRPFSLWEQITLYELLVQHTLPVPAFSQWLDSPNPTVIMFALRMVREYKQKESEPEVVNVLSHQESRVKHLAIEVAGDLDMRSTLEVMKKMYKNEDYNNCLEILRSMAKMPEPSMLGFLKLVLDKEDDVQLQIEATRAIENMGEVGVAALVKVMKSEYKNYNIIIRHVLDRRIN
jgi:HEAT repeat protein